MSSLDILKNVVGLSLSAVDVSASSASILSSARDIQSAATSMAGAVEELAASVSEIESSARNSSHAAQDSRKLTQEGASEIRELNRMIDQSVGIFSTVATQTQDLQQAVVSLSKVVDLISTIAGQTNLLALNATIEAARAGEQGKGFAVVAGEVKSLSRQTREATEKITTQISQLNHSFRQVLEGMTSAREVMQTVGMKSQKALTDFDSINQNAGTISDQVAELAHIISQQRVAVEMLARNMTVVKDKGAANLNDVERLAGQTDATITLIEKWRTEVASEDIANKVVYLAKADHALWKKRLLDMALGRSKTKASELADHTLCRLGKWYYAQSGNSISSRTAFRDLEEPHKQVHHHGIEAAKLFEAGKLEEGLRHYHQLERASGDVLACLDRLIAEL